MEVTKYCNVCVYMSKNSSKCLLRRGVDILKVTKVVGQWGLALSGGDTCQKV